jgi:hypothetical protein
MAEVHEVHEVEVPVETRRRGVLFPFIMFLLGGALIAAVVVAILNVRSTIAWPAGEVSLGPNTSVAEAGNPAVLPPSTVPAPTVIAPSVTQNEVPTVNTASPSQTTTPAVGTDDSTSQSSSAPADTTEPQ